MLGCWSTSWLTGGMGDMSWEKKVVDGVPHISFGETETDRGPSYEWTPMGS